MPFKFQHTHLRDVILVEAVAFEDERGFFAELFVSETYRDNGIDLRFVQDNHSRSGAHVLRGLHYQKDPFAQGKLVSAIRGAIFDVAVDLRRGSPTFGCWVGEVLSEHNHRLLWVPPGFAHGFCVLTEYADVVYKVTAPYVAIADRGLAWNDPEIGIDWPVSDPILSQKDAVQPTLANADNNFIYAATEAG